MRYLRPVRIDEKKSKGQIARAEAKDAREELILRRHGVLDSTGPRKMAGAYRSAQLSGDPDKADKVRADARNKKKIMRQRLARASTAGDRYTLAGLQPQNSSVIPLTLPNIMEINIVKGADGKPVVASGNGTRLKNIGQPTEAALKRRRAGTQNARSERLLTSKQASDRRTALIKRGRREEATQVPSPPVSTDGIGGNRPGGDAESAEARHRGIASRGHTR